MITFEQTIDDFVALNEHYRKTHLSFFQKYWRWLLVGIFAWYVFKTGPIMDSLLSWGNWVIVGFVALITLLLIRFGAWGKRKNVIAYVKANPQNLGLRQIDYDEEKITITTDSSSIDYKYNAFIKIEENDKFFFAFIGEQTAIIMPKRVSDKEGLLKLIAKLKGKIK